MSHEAISSAQFGSVGAFLDPPEGGYETKGQGAPEDRSAMRVPEGYNYALARDVSMTDAEQAAKFAALSQSHLMAGLEADLSDQPDVAARHDALHAQYEGQARRHAAASGVYSGNDLYNLSVGRYGKH